MVEPEVAFADLNDNADLAELFLKGIFKAVLDERPDDMAFFAERVQPDAITRLEAFVAKPFERIDYTEAVSILQKSGKSSNTPSPGASTCRPSTSATWPRNISVAPWSS